MQDVSKNIEDTIQVLTVFDDITADMISNKDTKSTCHHVMSAVFITQSYFQIPNEFTHYYTLYTLFCYENSEKKRTSTNCSKSFIRY